MGAADTINGVANDRCCDEGCRGMLLGVPQSVSGGRDGFAAGSGPRQHSGPKAATGSGVGDVDDRAGTSQAQGGGAWTGDEAGLRSERGSD